MILRARTQSAAFYSGHPGQSPLVPNDIEPRYKDKVGSLPTSLRAVSEAPASEELGVETMCWGRFRYSDLKEAAPGDYGICIGMSRS